MSNPAKKGGEDWIVYAVLLVPVLWFAVLLAQSAAPGMNLKEIIAALSATLETPFALRWTEKTPVFLLVAVFLYIMGIAYVQSTKGNTRLREEHGSAKWGNPGQLAARYADRKHPQDNVILTRRVRMGMDTRKHRRNLNVLVIGGSGAGKTRSFVKGNIYNCNCSYLCCDPKGEIVRAAGPLLEAQGYDVRVFDLIDLAQSDCYNPFCYLRDDKDALILVHNLIKSTTSKVNKGSDPFWEKAETALLSALILYLFHEAPRDEQNFATVMYMLQNAGASEENEEYQSPLDILFEALSEEQPGHIAVKQYAVFTQAAGKTAKSIIVSAAVRLAAWNLEPLQRITSRDDMDFGSMGERKRAIFLVIPDHDSTFNYIVSLMYSSAFQALYHKADREYGGRLPVHVRVIQDEWANVALPADYEKILSTCRSREISVSIIVQNMAQIKAMFKDSWENITGNCDALLYLGGNEQSTHKYISELLGKSTIDTKTRGVTRGRSGGSSENFQNAGRELLTPDEVRMLDNRYALLFVRGELPILDDKYDLLKHPHVKQTEDGGAQPYKRASHSYEQQDLSIPFTSLDNIDFMD